jgi:hypothetical protein
MKKKENLHKELSNTQKSDNSESYMRRDKSLYNKEKGDERDHERKKEADNVRGKSSL